MCKYLFKILLLIPLDILSEVKFLNHLVILSLIFFSNCHTVFHSSCIILHLGLPSSYGAPIMCGLLWGGSQHPGMFYDTGRTSIMSEANVIW